MVARFKPSNGKNGLVPAKIGRPTKYDPAYVRQVEKLCRLGATDAEIADFFQISLPTLYQWKALYEEFANSIKVGKDLPNQRVIRSLYQRACGFWITTEKLFLVKDEKFDKNGKLIKVSQRVQHEPTKEYYPPDVGAIAFFTKNRMPGEWKDKHEIDGTLRTEHVFTFNIFENNLGASSKPMVIESKANGAHDPT